MTGYVNARNEYGAYSGRQFFITQWIAGTLLAEIANDGYENQNIANYYMNVDIDNLGKNLACDKIYEIALAESSEQLKVDNDLSAVADISVNEIIEREF